MRATWRTFSDRGGRLLSGAVAFYALLSIVPMFLVALRIAGFATSEATARRALLENVARWVGDGGAATVGSMLALAESGGAEKSAGIVGTVVLLYASTRLFSQLTRALNVMWNVKRPVAGGFKAKAFLEARKRGAAFLLIGAVGLLLTVLVVGKIVLVAAENALDPSLSAAILWRSVESLTSFLVCAVLFGLVFYVLPNARLAWRDLIVGALVTAAFFSAGAILISMYVARKGAGSVYGAATSLVLLLLWVHYSAQVFFLGAAFTAVHAEARGRPIVQHDP
ncbi:MAG: YihY/virulence factor BrkB family protein [Polyangiaceae bacterium]